MSDKPQIACPKCGTMIALDEGLAGPLIAKIKAESETLVAQARAEADKRLAAVAAAEAANAATLKELSEREAGIQTTINLKLVEERASIIAAERENLRKELAPELQAEQAKAAALATELKAAQAAELTLRKEKDELVKREETLELEVLRQVDEKRKGIQEEAEKAAAENARLRLAEKDKTISDMQIQLAEAQRKGNQGSQQLQGEVLEMDFELTLRQYFPQDTVEPVKAGARGGDLLQRVLGEMARSVGTVFWEIKRAQSWGADWTQKARVDATEAKADVTIIVSEVLPKGVTDMGFVDGLWVTRPAFAVQLCCALRQGIISIGEARQGAVGREGKTERLYAYMIGPEFKATLEGIALPFLELQDELMTEKRATLSRWKRQERRIERVLTSVAGLQGDLQGIAGSEMPELPGFEPVVEVPENE